MIGAVRECAQKERHVLIEKVVTGLGFRQARGHEIDGVRGDGIGNAGRN
jgi:hypothetical protein